MTQEWFPGRLRELREQIGLTQQELAERVGVQRDAVARWEAGRREPSWSNVLALAAALGVDCMAFNEAPAKAPERGRGRPRKVAPEEARPKGKPTRKRKK